MKRKRGFTLIELLAVLVILPVLMIIAYPAVISFINQAGDQYYKTLEDNLRLAAMDFVQENKEYLPSNVGNTSRILGSDLVRYKEIEKITDKEGRSCTSSYVVIQKKGTNDYEYTSCVKCNDYQTNNVLCSTNILATNEFFANSYKKWL